MSLVLARFPTLKEKKIAMYPVVIFKNIFKNLKQLLLLTVI